MGKKIIVYVSDRNLRFGIGIAIFLTYMIFSLKVSIPVFPSDTNQLLQITFIGLALGTDAFSLSIGIGMKRICAYDILKTSVIIGIFHVIMPLIGLLLGEILGTALGVYAKYIGSILIALIGVNMLIESCKDNGEKDCDKKIVGWSLIILAISVSLDALTVGLGLGTIGFSLPLAVGIIGIFGGVMTSIGLIFGRYLGAWFGEKSEFVGGIVLIILGLRILLS